MIPDKLVDLLVQFIDLFFFVRIVSVWEKGVVLRLGRYSRTVGPGWHLVWPFHFENLLTEHITPATTKLDAQSLTTSDGVAVEVSAVVTWRIVNVRKVLLECEGHEQVMLDSTTGVLAEHVTGVAWSDLTTEEFRRTLTTAVHARAKKWGIKILQVQLKDVTRCRSLRLFSGSAPPSPH
jgi:regulator of protease activity HflC (stomatin/prohibitin superfamily)